MNCYQISQNIFRFNIWNLNSLVIEGQIRIFFNRITGKWLLCKFGGFGGLTRYPEIKETPRYPTDEEIAILQPIIDRRLLGYYFYNREARFHLGEPLIGDKNRPRYGDSIAPWYSFFSDISEGNEEAINILTAGQEKLTFELTSN